MLVPNSYIKLVHQIKHTVLPVSKIHTALLANSKFGNPFYYLSHMSKELYHLKIITTVGKNRLIKVPGYLLFMNNS